MRISRPSIYYDGRTEIIAGRASRVGNFELLGYSLRDYEALYEEKFDLLRLINENEVVNWEGEYRAPLRDAKVIPRPKEGWLPIWRAVGGASGKCHESRTCRGANVFGDAWWASNFF